MRKFLTSLLFGSLIASSKQQAFDQTSSRVTTAGPDLNGLKDSSEWQEFDQKIIEIQQSSDKEISDEKFSAKAEYGSYSNAFYFALGIGALGIWAAMRNNDQVNYSVQEQGESEEELLGHLFGVVGILIEDNMIENATRILRERGDFVTEFRAEANTHVEGLAKQMINLVVGLKNLTPQELEAFQTIDPKKSVELLSQLIAESDQARDDFLEEHLNEIILQEKIADLEEEKRSQIKELMQSALSQILPFQVNNVDNHIVRRVMPRHEGPTRRVLRDEDFADFLAVFNDKAVTTFGNIAASTQSADFVKKICSEFDQDFCDQTAPKIEETLAEGGIKREIKSKISNAKAVSTLAEMDQKNYASLDNLGSGIISR